LKVPRVADETPTDPAASKVAKVSGKQLLIIFEEKKSQQSEGLGFTF